MYQKCKTVESTREHIPGPDKDFYICRHDERGGDYQQNPLEIVALLHICGIPFLGSLYAVLSAGSSGREGILLRIVISSAVYETV